MAGPTSGELQETPLISPVPPSPPPPPSFPPDTRYIGSLKRKKRNRTSIVRDDDATDSGESLTKLCGGPLAQSVERGADNAKVVSSRLTWTSIFSSFFLARSNDTSNDGRCPDSDTVCQQLLDAA